VYNFLIQMNIQNIPLSAPKDTAVYTGTPLKPIPPLMQTGRSAIGSASSLGQDQHPRARTAPLMRCAQNRLRRPDHIPSRGERSQAERSWARPDLPCGALPRAALARLAPRALTAAERGREMAAADGERRAPLHHEGQCARPHERKPPQDDHRCDAKRDGRALLMRAGAQTRPQSLETRASIAGFRKITAIWAVIGQPPMFCQRVSVCRCAFVRLFSKESKKWPKS
jgi:hypothetical protein